MHARVDEEITFRKLETLIAFMETGNLARAAERLEVSTVSVHRALHSLEVGVRCALFRHEGRNLHPTEAAHALAEVAREVLHTMSAGIRSTREVAGYSADRIRIGSLYSLTIRTVPAVLVHMKVRKPSLETELVLGSNADLLQKIRDGAVDAALMAVPEEAGDIVSEPLFEDDIYFAAPMGSRFAALDCVDLSECSDEKFVSLKEGFATYNGFVEAFRVANFTPNVVMKTGDIFSLMNLVSGGIGYTLLPGRVRDLFSQKVQLIPLAPKYLMRQTLGVSFLRTRERDPNLLALLAVCRSARAELA
ncbi:MULTISPECIES: LysR family transcriptional regulator [Variovorax]|jgi:LysR family malonate utilization transcriptional regulator|uniref:LysR family transcriptional regulator n=1 Tax=Variovorax TaxID=34072 RepID=UPI00089B7211|nr:MULTISPECIES: LysR family transcriptional regulator [unclassified Variovorax]SDZ33037.1 LysR family transcriptional regulator, malonate utilization transcriptional regulator [Variovorax sp. YR634]SOD28608.1 LysR family transcriptional regulator, malonate utilization transcriptional regulator [Variovorax sp. YR752]